MDLKKILSKEEKEKHLNETLKIIGIGAFYGLVGGSLVALVTKRKTLGIGLFGYIVGFHTSKANSYLKSKF